jgi:hypothetical protein
MGRKYKIYWYSEREDVRRAFLVHCRDRDLSDGPGISKGTIIQGAIGFAAAEKDVPGLTGRIVKFAPNRRCIWQGLELPCMAHPNAPPGTAPKSKFRHFNNIVAQLATPDAVNLAKRLGFYLCSRF